jgi:hypothetical protein
MQSATRLSPPEDSTALGSMHGHPRARPLPPPSKFRAAPFVPPAARRTHPQPYHLRPLACPTPTVTSRKFRSTQRCARHPASLIRSPQLLGEIQCRPSLPQSAASTRRLSHSVTMRSGSCWPLLRRCGARKHTPESDHPRSRPVPPPPVYYVSPSDLSLEHRIRAWL